MASARALAAAVLASVAGLFVWRRAQAAQLPAAASPAPAPSWIGDTLQQLVDQVTPAPTPMPPTFEDWGLPAPAPSVDRVAANRAAFLATISRAEGTDRGGDPYRVLFGGSQWAGDLNTHPAEQGWPGLPLPDYQCRAAGFGPGCVSTAAGRYQITRTTWRRVRHVASGFGPEAQDAMALELIRGRGALVDVDAGRFDAAIDKVRREWASLPGAGYAQPERDLPTLRAAFIQAGGVLA